MALVEQARLARALTPDAAGAALLALAAEPMTADGGFDGGVAGWLAGHLLPRLGVPPAPSFQTGATDLRLLAALAGAPEGESPVVDWEGLTYRFDPHVAQFERYRRTRDRLGGNRVDAVLALWALATELTAGVGAVGDLTPLADRLEASVRDEISHSGDFRVNQPTCAASEVLRHKAGWCFAKSHLLAALLRANSIPAGLCYQRLVDVDSETNWALSRPVRDLRRQPVRMPPQGLRFRAPCPTPPGRGGRLLR